MTVYDLPLAELRAYRSSVTRPVDFDAFWQGTLRESRAVSKPTRWVPVDTGLRLVDTYDVSFSGYAGDEIRAWLHIPKLGEKAPPVVVRYVGYNNGRGLPHVVDPLVLAGYAVLTIDNRAQGGIRNRIGDTPDGALFREIDGHVVRGFRSPETYYYRRLYTDAALAIDAVAQLPDVDSTRIAVAGTSQGGGLALAVASLTPGLRAAMIDVPFLSDFPRGIELCEPQSPYRELKDRFSSDFEAIGSAYETLRYFDGSVFAPSATAPAIFSVALLDSTCPPSTVFAAYNAYAGEKEIHEYPFNGHEGGSFHQESAEIRWLSHQMPV